jgi:hypothetical protein
MAATGLAGGLELDVGACLPVFLVLAMMVTLIVPDQH